MDKKKLPPVYIGTSGWHYPEWVNRFYPNNLPKKSWLEYYATQFNIVEINATFYRNFEEKIYLNWYNQTPAHFKYIIKASKIITHQRYLLNVTEQMQECESLAHLLKEKLAVILLQLPRNLPYDLKRLEEILRICKHPEKIAIEFRHPKWLNSEVQQLLSNYKVTFCDADSPGQSLNYWITGKNIYLRLHGHKKWYISDYSAVELKRIIQQINLKSLEIDNLYILFNNTQQFAALANARLLQEYFNTEFSALNTRKRDVITNI